MNWLDILLLVILGLSVIGGLRRGIARTSIGFAAVIAGLMLALWFHNSAGAYIADYIPSKTAANVAGFLVVFLLVVGAGALLGRLADHLIKAVHLSWLNRLLGGVFGLLRGVLLSALIVFLLMAFALKTPPLAVSRSFVAPYVVGGARAIAAAAPHDIRQAFRASYERLRQIWLRRLPEQEM